MANEPKNDPGKSQVQTIPLAKIHYLPGVETPQAPDKSYGGLVSSIQSSGVLHPVILRLREDGEYQVLDGLRRRRACELAKKKEIPALVYEMELKEAVDYFKKHQGVPGMPIPGKLIPPPTEKGKEKTEEKKPPVAPGTDTPPAEKEKAGDKVPAPTGDSKGKADGEKAPPKEEKPPAAPKEKAEVPDAPAAGGPAPEDKPVGEKKADDPKLGKVVGFPKEKAAAPAASGPSGTAIKRVYDNRLNPPDEKALKDLPVPQGDEAYFITLHPSYLEKSKFNEFSVDQESENFKELFKAIELAGVKDPVLARPKEGGGLEILSGQRRHIVASVLNYPVPTIVQNIDDDDAKIIVADCNLHRDKITSYDLSRALRMKMDGMKRKAGRRKKSDPSAKLLNTDEALAKEMGMSTSKLNRIVRLSEAIKEVCQRYDDGSIELSIAYSLSFLKPKTQEALLNLSDIGYKLTSKRVDRIRPLEKGGKLTEQAMRDILEDKDMEPAKTQTPQSGSNAPSGPSAITGGSEALPPSPDVPSAPGDETPGGDTQGEAPDGDTQGEAPQEPKDQEEDITKGKQERPEQTKIILTGDRLRKYFPDVSMTPREIEESIYEALEERERRRAKQKEKQEIFKGGKVK